jgi:hypothetical protein
MFFYITPYNELMNQILYLGFTQEGTGLHYSYNDALSIPVSDRIKLCELLSERFDKISEQYKRSK